MPVGSCVISRGSSGCSMGSSLGAVGHSSPGPSSATMSNTSASNKTYVDNRQNRQLGRVGMPLGSMPVSKHNSSPASNSVVCAFGQTLRPTSPSGSSKTYLDNSFNRRHDRVGLQLGSKVISKSGKQDPSTSNDSKNSDETSLGASCGDGGQVKVYKDNPLNRRLNRVGQPVGTMVYSKKRTPGSDSKTSTATYVDNARNRKLERVGKPRGSQPNRHTSEKTHKKRAIIDGILQDDELFDVDGTQYLSVYGDDDIIEEAVCFINRKFEELRWQDKSELEETPKTSTSLIDGYCGQQINFDEIDLGKKIGQGGFGDVYFASWRGTPVAVKKLRIQTVSKKRLRDFTDEVLAFCDLDHPNIVRFIGACITAPNLAIVMEYMHMSLFDALHMDHTVDFTEDERLSILRQTTSGLLYLHKREIAHCDLKSQNVLLNHTSTDETAVTAKITDFGLSMIKNDAQTSRSQAADELVRNVGTPRYSAPEVLRGEFLSADGMMRADVYSLSLIVYEVIFEEEPFYDYTYPQLQKQVGEAGVTPDIPDGTEIDGKLQQLLRRSWSFDSLRRPKAKELFDSFETASHIYLQQ